MKRLLILTACAALFMSGCRACPWFKRNRGAPCRSNLTFDPYAGAAAPAPVAGCGIDAGFGEVSVGYGGADCPNCQPGGIVDGGAVGGIVGGGDYYGDGTVMESMPGGVPSTPPASVMEPATVPPVP